jgi:hypothetical protein
VRISRTPREIDATCDACHRRYRDPGPGAVAAARVASLSGGSHPAG